MVSGIHLSLADTLRAAFTAQCPSMSSCRSVQLGVCIAAVSLLLAVWALLPVETSIPLLFDHQPDGVLLLTDLLANQNNARQALAALSRPGKKGRRDRMMWLAADGDVHNRPTLQNVFLAFSRGEESCPESGRSTTAASWASATTSSRSVVSSAGGDVGLAVNRTDALRISRSSAIASFGALSSAPCDFSAMWRNGSAFCDTSSGSDCLNVSSPSFTGSRIGLLLVRRALSSDDNCDSSGRMLDLEILAAERKSMLRLPPAPLSSQQHGFFVVAGDNDGSGSSHEQERFAALVPGRAFVDMTHTANNSENQSSSHVSSSLQAVRLWLEKRRKSSCDTQQQQQQQQQQNPQKQRPWTALLVTEGNLRLADSSSILPETTAAMERLTFITVQNVSSSIVALLPIGEDTDGASDIARNALHLLSLVVSAGIMCALCRLLYLGDAEPFSASPCGDSGSNRRRQQEQQHMAQPVILSPLLVTMPLAAVQLIFVSDPVWLFTWVSTSSSSSSLDKPFQSGSLFGGAVAARWSDLLFRCFVVPALATAHWWLGTGRREGKSNAAPSRTTDASSLSEKHRECNETTPSPTNNNNSSSNNDDDSGNVEQSKHRRQSRNENPGAIAASSLWSLVLPPNSNNHVKPVAFASVFMPFISAELSSAFAPTCALLAAVAFHALEAVSASFPGACAVFALGSELCGGGAAPTDESFIDSAPRGAPDSITGYSVVDSQFPVFSGLWLLLQGVSLLASLGFVITASARQPESGTRGRDIGSTVQQNPQRRRWLSVLWGIQAILVPLVLVDLAFLVVSSPLVSAPVFVVADRLYIGGSAPLLSGSHGSAAFCLYSLWRLILVVCVLHPAPSRLRAYCMARSEASDDGWRHKLFAGMFLRARVILGQCMGNSKAVRETMEENLVPLSQARPATTILVVGSAEHDDDNDNDDDDKSGADHHRRDDPEDGAGEGNDEHVPAAAPAAADAAAGHSSARFSVHQLLSLPRPATSLQKLSVVQPQFLPTSGAIVDDAIKNAVRTARLAVAQGRLRRKNSAAADHDDDDEVLGQPRHIVSVQLQAMCNDNINNNNKSDSEKKRESTAVPSTSSPSSPDAIATKAVIDTSEPLPSPLLAAAARTATHDDDDGDDSDGGFAGAMGAGGTIDVLSWFSIPRALGRSARDRQRSAKSVTEQLMLVRHRMNPENMHNLIASSAHHAVSPSTALAAATETEQLLRQGAGQALLFPSASPAAAFEGERADDDGSSSSKNNGEDDAAATLVLEPMRVEFLSREQNDAGENIGALTPDSCCVDDAVSFGCAALKLFCNAHEQQQQQQQHHLFFVDLAAVCNNNNSKDDNCSSSCFSMTLTAQTVLSDLHSSSASPGSNIRTCTIVDSYRAAEEGLKATGILATRAAAGAAETKTDSSSSGTPPHIFVVKIVASGAGIASAEKQRAGGERETIRFAPSSTLCQLNKRPVLVTELPCIRLSNADGDVDRDFDVMAAPSRLALELLARNRLY